jgi:hypothetical protein
MELRFHAALIEAWLDGKPVAAVRNDEHTHGMFALGSEWNLVQFDNLQVKP